VAGLPKNVTLPAHTQESVRFLVSVPAATGPAQYLAGITASPETAQPAPVKSNERTQTGVTIVSRVIIGVAVTVGIVGTRYTTGLYQVSSPGMRDVASGPHDPRA
jgi:hypothetical protein